MKKILSVLLVLVLVFLAFILIVGKTTITYNSEKPVFSESKFSKQYYDTDKLLLVNAWATWCAPCIAEFPTLEKIQQQNPALTLVSISLDEDTIRLKKYLNKNPHVKSLDVTVDNFKYRKQIYGEIGLVDAKASDDILQFESKTIPYLAIIKHKKILYRSYDLDTVAIQRVISQNKD